MLLHLKKIWSGYVADSRGFFENGWEYISTGNLHMLKRCSNIAVGVILAYLVAAIVSDCSYDIKAVYAGSLLFHGLFCVYIHLNAARLKWRTRVIQWLCLLFLLSLLMTVVYIAAIGMNNEPGIYFAPLTIVLSMVFILRVWQSAAIVTFTTALFIFLSSRYKVYHMFQLDVSMGIVAWVLSMIADLEILHLRLRDFRLRSDLMHLSCTDSLTGLMNKSTAEATARSYLARCGNRESSALFVIDLDQFKQINDILGHQAGDEALEVVGNALMKLFRSQDIVGRVGGDEFVALMKNTCDRKLIARRAAVICTTVRHTRLEKYTLCLTCSVGVAVCPSHGVTYDALFKKADEQLYRVKRGGKNGYLLAK